MAGTFADGHQHAYTEVETFFNPYHAVIYTGGLFVFAAFALAALRNVRRGYPLVRSVPRAYSHWLFTGALFLVSGLGDLTWHALFGFEGGIDVLVSPPHIGLLSAGALLGAGPIRSAFARRPTSLAGQLPALLGMGALVATVQFATQYAFYPEIFAHDAPLSPGAHPAEQVVLYTLTHYRETEGMLIVLWQAILLAGPVAFLMSRMRLAFGALAVLSVAVKIFVAAEVSRNAAELAVVLVAAALAGLTGDIVAARLRERFSGASLVRICAAVVPMAYTALVFALAVPLASGTWWNQNLVYGMIAESGLAGLLIGNLAAPSPQQPES